MRLAPRFAALAALAVSPLSAAEVSPDLVAQLAVHPTVDALVYYRDETPGPRRALEDTGRMIPRLQENLAASRRHLAAALGGLPESGVTELWISNAFALRLDGAQVKALAADPRVARVLYDAPISAPKVIDEGDAAPEAGVTYGLRQLKVDQVRKKYGLTGAGVVVGHLDTGYDNSHPDLLGRLKAYKNFRGWGSSPKDDDGHGTHTAATIVGGAASGKSIGVAPGARLLSGRVMGRGFGSQTSALLKGMQWMLDPDGKPATRDQPKVVSMSFHSGSGNQNAFYEAMKRFERAGIIPSWSAGNSGSKGLTHPKEYPGNFVTAAVNSAGRVASFSSRGPATYKGRTVNKPDWAAPGVSVYSAETGGGYSRKSGTSMACPHISGVLALMFEADPGMTASEARAILYQTAIDAGSDGWDGAYGMGRVDALAAVEAVKAARAARIHGTSPLDRELSAQDLLLDLDRFQRFFWRQ